MCIYVTAGMLMAKGASLMVVCVAQRPIVTARMTVLNITLWKCDTCTVALPLSTVLPIVFGCVHTCFQERIVFDRLSFKYGRFPCNRFLDDFPVVK